VHSVRIATPGKTRYSWFARDLKLIKRLDNIHVNTKVLVIEDDEQLGDLLTTELTSEAYECELFRTIDGVTEALAAKDPDVILLDLMLPDGSGYDLLKSIRSISSVPIIVISARILGEDKVRALDLGADDYVSKPFWINELSARIRAVMRRKVSDSSTSPEIVEIDSISIHFQSREVHKNGVPLALTPTEFGLLEFFVRRPKQAIKREELIDAIFKNPASASEALQTHISRLRKKLGAAGARITTVWGVGYRFDPPSFG